MKKIISMLLCVCLLSSMAVMAFADGEVSYPTGKTGNFDTPYSVDITAIASNSTATAQNHNYSVEIIWGDMAFAWGYTAAKESTWDPDTHTWSEATNIDTSTATKAWRLVTETALTDPGAVAANLTTNDAVLVYNHSSLPVLAKIEIDNTDATTDVIYEAGITANFTATSANSTTDASGNYTLVAAAVDSARHDLTNNKNAMVYGQVSLTNPTDESKILETVSNVAKLNVTISKPTT